MKYIIALVLVISVSATYYLSNTTMGIKPKLTYEEKVKTNNKNHIGQLEKISLANYPDLDKRYKELKEVKEKSKNLVALKNDLRNKYQEVRSTGETARELAFFYLDLLLKINKIDPKDSDSILELADLSFERKVFSKASEYYQKYLELKDDSTVRARYASTLTFLGNYQDAITELDSIIKNEPKNFQALAFKTIALAQNSDVEGALKVGELALSNAPNDEAYTRFGSYLQKLKNNDSSLEAYLQNNEVTKLKFNKIVESDSSIDIYFTDFPMDKMPEFAKEKFFTNIRNSLDKEQKIKQVNFLDSKTNKIMTKLN